MNSTEALNLLVQAASLARLTKQEHVQIEQAGVMLKKTIEKRHDGEKKTTNQQGRNARK